MNKTPITVVGNLVDDPELRFTPSGAPVANFRIASTPRSFDRATNEWKDGDTMFLTCSVWRAQAENVAESLERGMRVIVEGTLKARTYETREGEKRTVFEVEVDEVGPSLFRATAKVTKRSSSGAGGGSGNGSSGGWGGGGQGASSASSGSRGDSPWGGSGSSQSRSSDDPWATSAPSAAPGDPWARQQSDEPPF